IGGALLLARLVRVARLRAALAARAATRAAIPVLLLALRPALPRRVRILVVRAAVVLVGGVATRGALALRARAGAVLLGILALRARLLVVLRLVGRALLLVGLVVLAELRAVLHVRRHGHVSGADARARARRPFHVDLRGRELAERHSND